jgi:dipeptidyl aminopeptidase/acylaminoacyl peptidase
VRSPFSVTDAGVPAYHPGPVRNLARLTWLDRTGTAVGTVGEIAGYANLDLSPDGKRLAVSSSTVGRGDYDIRIMDLSRNGDRERLTRTARSSCFNDGPELRIFHPNSDGKEFVLRTREFRERNAVFSPDGLWIAYSSDKSGRREIYVRNLPSGDAEQKVSVDGGVAPRWSDDTYAVRGDGQRFLMPVPVDPRDAPPITVLLNWQANLRLATIHALATVVVEHCCGAGPDESRMPLG